jgi:3'(2'), 5'-bisphosphate nucleotidase
MALTLHPPSITCCPTFVTYASSGVMIDQLIQAALAAGAEIMAVHAAMVSDDVRSKSDGSPVTQADERAEVIILSALADLTPDIPVVAEEQASAGNIPDTPARFWLVDPLDGTREFVNGSLDFTVNIALIDSGVPVIGVVFVPGTGALYVGDGNGARMTDVPDGDWRPIHVAQPDIEALRFFASRSHLSAETRDFIGQFAVSEMISAGSSLKFCKLAAGEADLYPRLSRTMEWDTAAGDAILRAAGGRVLTMDGQPLTYGKRNQASDTDFANPWFVATGPFDPFGVTP